MRGECERWMTEINDMGFIKESDIIDSFWPNNIQPLTATPMVYNDDGRIKISCNTHGASMGYKHQTQDTPWIGWTPYTRPFNLESGKTIKVIAHRLGYKPSETILYTKP